MQTRTAITHVAPMRSLAMEADCYAMRVDPTPSNRRWLPCATQPMLSPIYRSVN